MHILSFYLVEANLQKFKVILVMHIYIYIKRDIYPLFQIANNDMY